MEPEHYPVCAGCDGALKPGDPFCLDCGRLCPPLMNTGTFAIEVQDVPGQRSRDELIALLRAWFPTVDPIRAEERFRSEWQVLMSGVDEISARRLQDALKKLKIDTRLVREEGERSWTESLVNPALTVTAACVLLSLALGALAALVLLPIGIAAPFAWALQAGRKHRPLLRLEEPSPRYEKWSRLAQEYAKVVLKLSLEDRKVIKALSRTIFDLQLQLGSDSLAAVAAGEDRGDLYARLTEAIHTALSLGRRISDLEDKDEEERSSLRQELVALARMVSGTSDWFETLETRPPKETIHLNNELREATERIDRILGQVHSRSETPQRPRKPLNV